MSRTLGLGFSAANEAPLSRGMSKKIAGNFIKVSGLGEPDVEVHCRTGKH
jgi:hypothetical protein